MKREWSHLLRKSLGGDAGVNVQQPAAAARREFRLVLVVWIASSLALSRLDLFEMFSAWSRRHEHWNVDELAVVCFDGFVLTAGFAWWRYRQEKVEARVLQRTQLALAVTNQRYRSLFDYHPDAVFALNTEGLMVAANDACQQMTGRSAEELRGMHFTELLEAEHVPAIAVAFFNVLAREPQTVQGAVARRDGHTVEIMVTGLPIVVEDEVVGVYGIAEDITERNRTQRALSHAQEAAEAANESKSLFLANVSHEIRTPLTSVLGNTEILQETDLDPMQTRFVEIVHRSGERLLTLVNDILDFSKIEAGKLRVYERKFDLRALVTEVVELMRPTALAKGLAFECWLDPDLPVLLMSDQDRIAQILTNLADNAVKFTDAGCVSIRVLVAHRREDLVEVVLEVQDSGIGVPAAEHKTLFEAFHQGDPSITRKYGGTGLGLAITQELTEVLSGTITLQSSPGAGSTFRVTLPLQIANGGATTSPEETRQLTQSAN